MIDRPTVLILGAGASAPYGFWTGRNLLLHIVADLRQSHSLWHSVHDLRDFEPSEIYKFREELSMSGQPSVDAFLEYREEFKDVGKAAIAASLIPKEDPNHLLPQSELNWHEYLFNQLGARSEDFSDNRLSVVTFNYDRSFEYYIYRSLKHTYGLELTEAMELSKSIRVVHVHGNLGELALSDSGSGRVFEPDLHPDKLRKAIAGIRIIPEIERSSEEFEIAKELIGSAEVVCFLGFGYLPTNVDRLGVGGIAKRSPSKRQVVFGTVFQEGEAKVGRVRSALGQDVRLGDFHDDCIRFLSNHPVF